MRTLDVSIEISGRQIPVGSISGDSVYTAVFRYSEEYLSAPQSRAISVSLPLQPESFTPEQTRIFFEGLLPEGFLRRTVAESTRTDQTDYLTLLELLGSECLGAIQITGGSVPVPAPAYRRISPDSLSELAAEGASRSADMVVEAHLSLTGASGKIGVYRDKEGQWYLPVGSAPSTHILKQSHIRYQEIIQNEYLCLLTARKLGIPTSGCFILPCSSEAEAEQVLFASERYDRRFSDHPHRISGLPCPLRLHQEDFCQALGIPAAEKYEANGSHYLRKMFDLLRTRSANPIEDQFRLWDMLVFHYLIGNTDGHIKNYSLLYSRDLGAMRLAPAYDIVSTVIYETHSRKMAFSVGGTLDWSSVTPEHFRYETELLGLNTRLFMQRYDHLAARFETALNESAERMAHDGFTGSRELAARILETRKRKIAESAFFH